MALNRGSTGLSVFRGSTQQKVYRGSTLVLDVSTEDSVEWTGTLRCASGNLFGSYNSNGTENENAFSGFQIPADWMDNNTVAYVRSLRMDRSGTTRRFRLRLSASDSGFGTEAGPDFISALEGNLRIEILVNSVTRVVDWSDDNTADTAEPYSYSFLNGTSSFTSITELVGLSIGTHTTTIKLINPN